MAGHASVCEASVQAQMGFAAYGLLAGVGMADLLSGPDYTFSLIYLGPVALTAWHRGGIAVALIALSTAAVWILVDFRASRVGADMLAYTWNFFSRVATLAVVGALIASLRRSLWLERTRAMTDPLTGLLNRRAFREAIDAEVARCRRNGARLTLAFIDVDRFKGLNDTFGHRAGDAALVEIGRVLTETVRRSDSVARIGGDEFAVLFVEVDRAQAGVVVPQVHRALANLATERQWAIGFSVGATTTSEWPAGVDDLLSAADTLMYSVKAGTGDGVALGELDVVILRNADERDGQWSGGLDAAASRPNSALAPREHGRCGGKQVRP